MSETKYYGKYRGTVVNNVDPLQVGRIQVMVPDVSNIMLSSWAMPCAPVGGIQMGMFAVPLIGAGVWVEFEHGDADFPIWVGCFWGSKAEVPTYPSLTPPALPGITIQTPLQNGIIINDVPGPLGGIVLKTATASLVVNATGIYLENGAGASITMLANTVTINKGALVVI
jgi:uncharacterized protein involved in type VI secretion and phage assembly